MIIYSDKDVDVVRLEKSIISFLKIKHKLFFLSFLCVCEICNCIIAADVNHLFQFVKHLVTLIISNEQ